MAISLDSLTRFSSKADTKEPPLRHAFIDESEQVLRPDSRHACVVAGMINILIRQIRTAKRIICL